MFRNDWEIKIEERIEFLQVQIWLYKVIGEKFYRADFDNGLLVEKEHDLKNNPEVPATFRLPIGLWDEMKKKLIDNKARDKQEVEAELGATKYHLEDMRTLLKLNTPKND